MKFIILIPFFVSLLHAGDMFLENTSLLTLLTFLLVLISPIIIGFTSKKTKIIFFTLMVINISIDSFISYVEDYTPRISHWFQQPYEYGTYSETEEVECLKGKKITGIAGRYGSYFVMADRDIIRLDSVNYRNKKLTCKGKASIHDYTRAEKPVENKHIKVLDKQNKQFITDNNKTTYLRYMPKHLLYFYQDDSYYIVYEEVDGLYRLVNTLTINYTEVQKRIKLFIDSLIKPKWNKPDLTKINTKVNKQKLKKIIQLFNPYTKKSHDILKYTVLSYDDNSSIVKTFLVDKNQEFIFYLEKKDKWEIIDIKFAGDFPSNTIVEEDITYSGFNEHSIEDQKEQKLLIDKFRKKEKAKNKRVNRAYKTYEQDVKRGVPPIFAAIQNRLYNKLLEILISGADIEIKNKFGDTPLIFALYQNDDKLVKILLEHGATPNVMIGNGLYSALSKIVVTNKISTAKLLLEYGADVNYQNNKSQTALTVATNECKNFDMVKLLLDNGADPDLIDRFGFTTKTGLFRLCKKGAEYDKMMKLLLKD